MSMRGFLQFVAGALVGATMGCATALLVTPRTGRQVRDSLSKEARRLAARAYNSCGNLDDLTDLITTEASENIVRNIQDIRSAGL